MHIAKPTSVKKLALLLNHEESPKQLFMYFLTLVWSSVYSSLERRDVSAIMELDHLTEKWVWNPIYVLCHPSPEWVDTKLNEMFKYVINKDATTFDCRLFFWTEIVIYRKCILIWWQDLVTMSVSYVFQRLTRGIIIQIKQYYRHC